MKGVLAYLVSWKDIDYNLMSRKIVNILVSRFFNWGEEGLKCQVIRKRKKK